MTDPVEEPHLSWSQLSTLGDCGVKYELTYVQQVPRAPQGALIAGRAIHAAIEWAEAEVEDEVPGWTTPTMVGLWFTNFLLDAIEEVGGADAIRWAGEKLMTKTVEGRRFVNYLTTFKPGQPWKPFPFKYLGKGDWAEIGEELNRLGEKGDDTAIHRILTTGSEDDRWWRKMGPVFLRRYCDLRVQDESSGVKLWDSHVERRITARLASGTSLTGFVDAAMVVTADGEVRIRDYKSGRPGGGSPMQLAIYAWLIGEAADIHPTSGEFVYLRGDSPSKLRPPPIDGERFARLVALVPDVMARHEAQAAAGVYPFNPSNYCVACSVKAFCAYGRELPDD